MYVSVLHYKYFPTKHHFTSSFKKTNLSESSALIIPSIFIHKMYILWSHKEYTYKHTSHYACNMLFKDKTKISFNQKTRNVISKKF